MYLCKSKTDVHCMLWSPSPYVTSALPDCLECTFVAAIVYSVGAEITSTINKKESTISVFQSPLVLLFTVNELRFCHCYQQHSLFNYSYWACSFSLLSEVLLCSFFFLAFKKLCFHAAWRCGEWQLEHFGWAWSYVGACLLCIRALIRGNEGALWDPGF